MIIPWIIYVFVLLSMHRKGGARCTTHHLQNVGRGCRIICDALRGGASGLCVAQEYFLVPECGKSHAKSRSSIFEHWTKHAASDLELALRSGRPVSGAIAQIEVGLDARARIMQESRRCLAVVYWKWLIAVSVVCGLRIILLPEQNLQNVLLGDVSLLAINSLLLGWALVAFHSLCCRFQPDGAGGHGDDLDTLRQWMRAQLAGSGGPMSLTDATHRRGSLNGRGKELDLSSDRNKLEYLMNWLPIVEIFGLGMPCSGILCWDRASLLWGS